MPSIARSIRTLAPPSAAGFSPTWRNAAPPGRLPVHAALLLLVVPGRAWLSRWFDARDRPRRCRRIAVTADAGRPHHSDSGPGLHEFTADVVRFVREAGVEQGLLTLFVQHTSCSLCIQENADPDVRRDLDEFFRRLVPSSDDPSMQWLTHTTEGADDMPAHIKAALTAVFAFDSGDGRPPGTWQWQGIYLFEHRHRAHLRRVVGAPERVTSL